MYIYIGPPRYPLSSNIHSNYMKKRYGFNYTNTNFFESFLEGLEDSLNYIYRLINLVYKPKQTCYVEFHSYDTWCFSSTLTPIILPMLRKLKEEKHGSPLVEDSDVPNELRGDDIDKKWDYVINEMIYAFSELSKDDWTNDYFTYEDASNELGIRCILKDPEGMKTNQARISNGLRLFGTYFESLWD